VYLRDSGMDTKLACSYFPDDGLVLFESYKNSVYVLKYTEKQEPAELQVNYAIIIGTILALSAAVGVAFHHYRKN